MELNKPKLRQSTLSFSSKSGLLSYSIKSQTEPISLPTISNNVCLEESNGGLNKIQASPGQRRLNDLKGVWVIEKITDYKEKLKDPNVSSEDKIEIVVRLQEKSPSTEMIQSTGIGTVIRNIAKSKQDQENIPSVRLIKESMKLYRHWKRLVERREDQDLVRRMENLNTTERQNQVKKLKDACKDCIDKNIKEREMDIELNVLYNLANSIEEYVFISTGQFIGSYYRRILQKLICDIRENKFKWFQKIFIIKENFRVIETGNNNVDKTTFVGDIVKEQLGDYILKSM